MSYTKLETALRNHFSRLQQRERIFVGILGMFLLLVLLWLLVWQPVEKLLEGNAASYRNAHEGYEWMQAHEQQARALNAGNVRSIPDNNSFLSTVSDIAKAYEISIGNVTPAEDGSLRLSLDNVAFNKLLPWLKDMEDNHSISATQISISRLQKSPGFVSASLTLKIQ